MIEGVTYGPCRNAQLDPETGEVVTPCPHDGEAPYIELPFGGIRGMGETGPAKRSLLRGMCAGCAADDDLDERRRELVRRYDRLERVKDGPRDRSWSFATYPSDSLGAPAAARALAWMQSYLAGERSNLLVWGNVGSGKTGLVWCVVRELIVDHGRDVQLVNWRNLLHDIRSGFDKDPTERRESLSRYFSVPLLFLDDVGAEKPTEWASEQLSILVDERYMSGRVTGITSNYTLPQLVTRLSPDGDTVVGQRIVSRLTEGATKLEVKTTKDRRL